MSVTIRVLRQKNENAASDASNSSVGIIKCPQLQNRAPLSCSFTFSSKSEFAQFARAFWTIISNLDANFLSTRNFSNFNYLTIGTKIDRIKTSSQFLAKKLLIL